MALTVSNLTTASIGNVLQARFRLAFDSSYLTGGELLTPAQIGLWTAQYFQVVSSEGGYAFDYDYTNTKIKVFDVAGGGLTGTIAAASAGTPAGTVGAPTFTGDALGTHTHTPTGGTQRMLEKYNTSTDVDYPSSENADQAGTVMAGVVVGTDTFTNFAGSLTPIVQTSLIHRGIEIAIQNATGGALDLFEGVTTFTITGTFRGNAQVELLTFTSTAGNKSVGAAKFRYKLGTKPFDTITSITYDNSPAGALNCFVGLGNVFGLSNPLKTPDASDVEFVLYGETKTALYSVDTTQGSIAITDIVAFDKVITIEYKTAGGTPTLSSDSAGTPAGTNSAPAFTGAALATHTHTATLSGTTTFTEVTNGTDLSALNSVECLVIGY
jgi:hypothetical protein